MALCRRLWPWDGIILTDGTGIIYRSHRLDPSCESPLFARGSAGLLDMGYLECSPPRANSRAGEGVPASFRAWP